MCRQVLLPRRLHGRLEGEHENALEAHVLRELVGGERLSEAHLRVPKELGRARAAVLLHGAEVCLGLVDGSLLLGTHLEVLGAAFGVLGAVAHGYVGGLHVVYRDAEPLGLLPVAVADLVVPVLVEVSVHVMVIEGRAVVPHGGGGEHDLVGLLTRLERRVVLVHAGFHGLSRVADLEQSFELRIVRLAIGVDLRPGLGPLWEEVTSQD